MTDQLPGLTVASRLGHLSTTTPSCPSAKTFQKGIGLQGGLRWIGLRVGAVSSFLTID
ncbi:MAG: hypothetical protein OXN89_13425 [Bryobacterales bacterium]|nr:hypothetical protein [Bryobacterales bacterium]